MFGVYWSLKGFGDLDGEGKVLNIMFCFPRKMARNFRSEYLKINLNLSLKLLCTTESPINSFTIFFI